MKCQLLFVIMVALISSSSLVLPVETRSSRESLVDNSQNSMLANERTIVVPDHFDKIQDAINHASEGDTVLVKANIYYENVVVNRSVYLLGEDQRDTIIDGGGGDVLTVVASKTVVAGFTIRNVGFSLGRGIKISKANGCVICNNVIKGNFVGVRLGDKTQETVGNIVRNNNITGNRYGVFLAHSKNSMVCRNVISGNGWNGVEIDWGEGNIVYANTISDSTAYGLEIPIETPSYHNIIYHNNFVNNTLGCTSSNYENTWDDGYPSGGNFWNDYLGADLKNGPSQSWLGSDGIGDTPYLVDQSMKDRYPLISPIFTFDVSKCNISYRVSIVSNSTIFNFSYESASSKIRFQVDGANGTLGFCRICIPHGLMTEPYNITINGGSPIFVNYTLSDNGTHRWIYFVYEHSTYEVIIVPEFPMMFLLFLIAVSTVVFAKACSSKSKGFPVNLSDVLWSSFPLIFVCLEERNTLLISFPSSIRNVVPLRLFSIG